MKKRIDQIVSVKAWKAIKEKYKLRADGGFYPTDQSVSDIVKEHAERLRLDPQAIRRALVARRLPHIGRRPWRLDLQDDGREPPPLG